MNNDEDPKDWEFEDENPPENLKRKWISRDHFGKKTIECPSCKELVPNEGITCILCGARIYHDSGLLGRLLKRIKGFFGSK